MLKFEKTLFMKSATAPEHFPSQRGKCAGFVPEIAVIGRSNVGKSSLINSLTRQKKLAKTSATPGKTQLINFFDVDGQCVLVDLPGYGYAAAPESVRKAWGPMIEGYLKGRMNLLLLLILLDARRDISPEDEQMLAWLNHFERPVAYVLTKCDKLKDRELAHNKQVIAQQLGIDPKELIIHSTEDPRGRPEIIQKVSALVEAL